MATAGFTPASQQDVFSLKNKPSSSLPSCRISGAEARTFYESLVSDQHEETEKPCSRPEARQRDRGDPGARQRSRRTRRRPRIEEGQPNHTDVQRGGTRESERSTMLLGLRLLRSAHEGDVTGIKELLSRGVDINFQDSFFWTAMMCASWSGQRSAVRLLLQHGAAWVGVVDTQGRDARDLAEEAGHSEVLEELLRYGESPPATESTSSVLQPQWCDVCRTEYSSSPSSHASSTLHQFSLQRAPPTPYYCLPASSNSYKMMVRSGWRPGEGLGPQGEGTNQPVATVLKRDQAGLGFGRTKRAKVTHFQARDGDAVKHPSREKEERIHRGERKEQSRRKEQREKNWERDFRASFYL